MSPDVAARVLAAATATLLPTPERTVAVQQPSSAHGPAKDLLAEARERLGLDQNDLSATARSRLLALLGDQMANAVLGGADEGRIKQRLGQRGELPLDLYKIHFPEDFNELVAPRAITQGDVERVLNEPDDVEHLLTDITDGEAGSLYVKTYGEESSRNRYTLLVDAKRQGDTLNVSTAWRIYHSDIVVQLAETPLGLLRAFVDIYGVPFSIGISQPVKFILHGVFRSERLPLHRVQKAQQLMEFAAPTEQAAEVYGSSSQKALSRISYSGQVW